MVLQVGRRPGPRDDPRRALPASNAKKDKIELTDAGQHLVRYSNPPTGKHAKAMDKLLEAVEQALHAHYRFARDQHYMVNDEKKIVIIDEGTGRPMPDRHWRDGLHQAVEAKERVPINMPSSTTRRRSRSRTSTGCTRSSAGMTGTLHAELLGAAQGVPAVDDARCRRTGRSCASVMPDAVFPTEDAKFDAVVADDHADARAPGRPVLIGTRTVEKSEEAVSTRLTALGVEHQVLNAEQNEGEAEIVAQAGQPGTVTVATNMAGRGTDIKLGPGVAAAGGLHVIGTERHEAERIDRQLDRPRRPAGRPRQCAVHAVAGGPVAGRAGAREAGRAGRSSGKAGGNRDWSAFAAAVPRGPAADRGAGTTASGST